MSTARAGRRAPVYRQVESELLRRIRDGELAPGQRLPTETDLAADWGVNRLTIRQAMGELARAGHVTVRQGSGTFVAEAPMVVELALPRMPSTDADAGSTASIAEFVQQDQTETLIDISAQDSTAGIAEHLAAPPPHIRIDTVVRTGGQPFLVCSYWLCARRFPDLAGLVAADGAGRVALYQLLQEHHGLRLRHDWRSLTAAVASREDAERLDVAPGSPVLLRDGVNVDPAGVPTVYLRRRLRGDRIRFTMRYENA